MELIEISLRALPIEVVECRCLMGETRVNLKHLLENLRDSYPLPLEEAIVTELVANALDSKASRIGFTVDSGECSLSIVDNGAGMKREEFEKYHDIAETTKEKGRGIGFAGQGAKLSLLAVRSVQTETKTSEGSFSTAWHLEDDYHAPWDFIPPLGLVGTQTGTAIKVLLREKQSDLANSTFVIRTIQKWFASLLEKDFMPKALREVYPSGVFFGVNGRMVELSQSSVFHDFATGYKLRPFEVRLKRKQVGIGFLGRSIRSLKEEERGLAISVLGKVVKRGWEWVDVSPKDRKFIWGMVEVPALSTILATNKCDFLSDVSSKTKYYQYRKAIVVAIQPILRAMGELPEAEPEALPQALAKEIRMVLEELLPDFPELEPLLDKQGRGEKVSTVLPDPAADPAGGVEQGVASVTGDQGGVGQGAGVDVGPGTGPGERISPEAPLTEPGRQHEGRRRLPGLMIRYEDKLEEELGRLEGITIFINKGHPAYRKVADSKSLENYHTFLTIAWVLSKNLADGRSPQGFINQFLRIWGG
ncbi:MAG: ATP-binding protein [Chloroflexi bacterium]|nr:ATP-binding protein [Chloroflexota bacterium]